VVNLEEDLEHAKAELDDAAEAYAMHASFVAAEDDTEADINDATATAADVLEECDRRPPLFSQFAEKSGYNGRVLSKYRIDCIVTTVFNHRKQYIQCKMQGLRASILKVDFNYKIAKKIRVWTKQGKSFQPFKCLVTFQNEDGFTVFWKAMKHSESFSEIKDDLARLRIRLNRNLRAFKVEKQRQDRLAAEAAGMDVVDIPIPDEEAVRLIYVDNCCGVYPSSEILHCLRILEECSWS
jgi:hypothetical protein